MTREKFGEILAIGIVALMVGAFCTGLGVAIWKNESCRDERELLQDMKEAKRDRERKRDERADWVLRCAERERRYNAYEGKWSEPDTASCLELLYSVETALAAEQPRLVQQ